MSMNTLQTKRQYVALVLELSSYTCSYMYCFLHVLLTVFQYKHSSLLFFPSGTCARQYLVVAASIGTTGVSVYISSTAPENVTLNIPDHSLPTLECDSYRCGLLLIQGQVELTVFVPVTNGFIMVTYNRGISPEYSFYPVEQDCQPVKAFYNSEHNRVFIECVNLSSETEGWLLWVEFRLSNRKIFRYSDQSILLRSNTLSEAVQVDKNVFLSDNGDVLHTNTEPSSTLSLDVLGSMGENCTVVSQINVVDSKVSLYCSRQDSSWSVLAGNMELRKSPTGFMYPCPGNSGKFVRLFEHELSFESVVVDNIDCDIEFGGCVGAEDSLAFWAMTSDGQLFSVPLSVNNQTRFNLTAPVGNNGVYLQPFFDETKSIGGYFNNMNASIEIVNLTGCHGHRTIPLNYEPRLLALTVGKEVDVCHCVVDPTISAKEIDKTPEIIGGSIAGVFVIIVVGFILVG